MDPDRAREMRQQALDERSEDQKDDGGEKEHKYCTMCGPNFCSMRISNSL